MNLLGKLLIVLIFIGSIGIASFSVVLYATHTNWRERAAKLEQDLNERTKTLTDHQKQKEMMEAALRLEINREASRSVALTERVRLLSQENGEAREEIAGLKNNLAVQVATVQAALETTELLRIRLDEVNRSLFDAQNDWAGMSTDLIRKSDEAHSLAIQLANYQSTAAQLAKDYQNIVEVLRIHGLSPDPALYSKRPPAGIHGTITAVRERGMVQVSIGSDSGLIKGHQLDVVRSRDGRSSLIGKIEITDTAADVAVARVLPEFRSGTVQLGDEVTYIEINEFAVH